MGRVSSLKRRVTITILAVAGLTAIAVWASPALAVPGGVTGLVSATHPDGGTWYTSNSPSFAWDPALADGWAIAGYSVLLDRNPYTDPDTTSDRNSLIYLPRVTYTVGSRPAEARMADLNGDGKPDLAVANYNQQHRERAAQQRQRHLRPQGRLRRRAPAPSSVAAADLNGDGKPDLAVANYSGNTVSVLLNNGNGTFAAKVDYLDGQRTPTRSRRRT